MRYSIAYGSTGMEFDLPTTLTVDRPPHIEENEISDPHNALLSAVTHPFKTPPLLTLLSRIRSGKICIVMSDHTRPVPNKLFLEVLSQLCNQAHISDDRIQVLIANGLHRKMTPSEMMERFGREFLERFDVINHDAFNEASLEYIGESTYKTPIYINKEYLHAALRIVTGYVEPHFFTGFSGGRKSIIPGIAGAETIKHNHSAEKIASDYARFGILTGNPIHEDALEIARLKSIEPHFLINVCLNSHHQITRIATGSLTAQNELCQYQNRTVFFPITSPYDVVITGNGGYPLDLNLYQAVKSMAVGELAVKQGGAIIAVNECRDGIGHQHFTSLISQNTSPDELLDEISAGQINLVDQWQVQILCRILQKARVYVVSSLQADQLGQIGLNYSSTIESAIQVYAQKQKIEIQSLRILLLSEGPGILPKLI